MPESRHGLPAPSLGSISVRLTRIVQDFADAFALVDCWLGFWADDYVEPIYFDRLPDLRSGVTGEDVAWGRFAAVLTGGLTPIGPRATTDRMLDRPTVDLFCAIAVDVHNLIASDAQPHRCQNERCPSSGWFVHQRGGAEHGQYRSTGVRYCSTRCRSAQGSRKSRWKAKQSQEKKS